MEQREFLRADEIPFLPPSVDVETKKVLKKVNLANREFARLDGVLKSIPNQYILIRILSIQEAKDSSEIECIVTTNDELYQAELFDKNDEMPEVKEVRNYARALIHGYELIREEGLLIHSSIYEIQQVLEENTAGIRRMQGTVLQNATTGEIVHVLPQDYETIMALMKNLERFINDDDFYPDVAPLIKMVLIHFQFESIHPFYDGNGRTGRIINVLYLVLKGLLQVPVLYLSRYIVRHKSEYYQLLRNVRTGNDWESFIIFMLDAVITTAKMTLRTIENIHEVMQEIKKEIRQKCPDLLVWTC